MAYTALSGNRMGSTWLKMSIEVKTCPLATIQTSQASTGSSAGSSPIRIMVAWLRATGDTERARPRPDHRRPQQHNPDPHPPADQEERPPAELRIAGAVERDPHPPQHNSR